MKEKMQQRAYKSPTEYSHREAFALMLYRCEKCGFVEQLWNSRDGVTPFIIACRNCGEAAQHSWWQLDYCAPNYKPMKGQRIFVDLSRERAIECAEKRINNPSLAEFRPTDKGELEKLKQSIFESIFSHGDSPDIQVFGE